MLTTHEADAVVILTDHSVRWFTDLNDVIHEQSLGNVETLAVNMWPRPKGVMLATLGRINVEYPTMHKVVMVDTNAELPIRKFLAGCGVEVICADTKEEGRAICTRRIKE